MQMIKRDGKIYWRVSADDVKELPEKEKILAEKSDTVKMCEDASVKHNEGIQTFMKACVNLLVYVPWGENGKLIPQYIEAGGFLNITNLSDIYGVAEKEFKSAYKIISK